MSRFGRPEAEYDVNVFVSFHLEELPGSYWLEQLGTEYPSGGQVMSLLQLRKVWGLGYGDEDDDFTVVDFTLPGDVTDNVIAVRFDDSGALDSVEMES